MFKKLLIGISCITAVSAAAALAGCGDNKDYSDKVQIIFELEGGKYSGRDAESVSHYYDYSDNLKIKPLDEFGEKVLTRDGGFTFEGWYKTKTKDADGKTVYSDKWDFATDKVSKEGVTLYARWDPAIVYTFAFVYFDANGEEQIAKSYKVQEGNKFGDAWSGDVLTYANYTGHTAIAVYYDPEHTKPFDDSIAHPGGEVSTAVKLYPEYLEGSYSLVKTAAQLEAAKSKNIYLLDDIDLNGAKLSFSGKVFIGNGHKVSNFTVDYKNLREDLTDNFVSGQKDTLCIAIFGNTQGVEVKDVTFENVTAVIDTFLSDITEIYVAPLAVSAKNSKFENVTVTGTFGYKELPDKLNVESNLVIVTDKGFVESVSENSTETNCSYDITYVGEIKDENE